MLADAYIVFVGSVVTGVAVVAPIFDVFHIAIADITVASTESAIATMSIIEVAIFLSLRIKLM